MSTSAHERRCWQFNHAARDIANSLFQKWALKGFFRRVSAASRGRGQPRRGYRRPKPTAHSDVGRLRSRRAACFLWYFLSLRKKVLPPRGGSPTVRAGVGASSPSSGRCMPTGAPEGFPRGKQSARFALPCAPLVVCLNDRSLTAFGGCIHWIPASLRSPLHPFGSPTETIERPVGLQALLPRRSRRVKPLADISYDKIVAQRHKQGAFRSPPAPLRTVVGEKTHKSFPRGKQSARPSLSEPP